MLLKKQKNPESIQVLEHLIAILNINLNPTGKQYLKEQLMLYNMLETLLKILSFMQKMQGELIMIF